MCDVIILVLLCINIATKANEKGRKRCRLRLLADCIVVWRRDSVAASWR